VAEYYYLIASLPSLFFGQAVPLEPAELLARAKGQLDADDFGLLESITLSANEDSERLTARYPEARAYYGWERRARWELASARAARRGVPFDRAAPDAPFEVTRSARDAVDAVMRADNPLEGELAFERARWAYLERIKNAHYFDMEWLVAYALQALSLSRIARFDAEAGRARYDATYGAVLESARYG
jgi:hypothetical protein